MDGLGEISDVAVLGILAPPVFLFLIANLLDPSVPDGADLEEYSDRQAPLHWAPVVAGTVVGTFMQPVIFGEPLFHPANLSGIPMIGICVVLTVSRDRRVHSAPGPIIMVMVLLDTILANRAISATSGP